MRFRGDKQAQGSQWRPVLIAAIVATVVASSAAVVAVARTVDFAPKVGDILVFRTGARMPPDWEFNAVTTTDQLPVSCKLRPAAMAAGGGSLVVEQRSKEARLYRVHWAGHQTSEPATDCGADADLLLSVNDLQLLSNAVGGPGVEHTAFGGLTVSSW